MEAGPVAHGVKTFAIFYTYHIKKKGENDQGHCYTTQTTTT